MTHAVGGSDVCARVRPACSCRAGAVRAGRVAATMRHGLKLMGMRMDPRRAPRRVDDERASEDELASSLEGVG